jgi:hypothetical protein
MAVSALPTKSKVRGAWVPLSCNLARTSLVREGAWCLCGGKPNASVCAVDSTPQQVVSRDDVVAIHAATVYDRELYEFALDRFRARAARAGCRLVSNTEAASAASARSQDGG